MATNNPVITVREEFVPNDRVIWQSDTAKTYRCPFCLRPVMSQYEGDEPPTIYCGNGHALKWSRV